MAGIPPQFLNNANSGNKAPAKKGAVPPQFQKKAPPHPAKQAAMNLKKKASDAAEEAGEPKLSPKMNALEEAREARQGG